MSGRCSGERLSCETAITGTSSSRARIFSPRLIWPTCSTRLSAERVGAHQLQVVDDHQAEPAAALLISLACRRRAFARSSRMSMSEESSIHSGALLERLAGLQHLRPVVAGDLALAQLVARHPGLARDEALGQLGDRHLEREQRDRACSLLSATFSAMFVTSALLPIEGRAASTIRFDFWKPPVMSSRSRKPEGVPVIDLPVARELLELVDLLVEDLVDRAEVAGASRRGRRRTACRSESSTSWWASPRRSATRDLDRLRHAEQPPQRGLRP